MKSLHFLFFGIFATLVFSWTGIVLVNQLGFGSLEPYTTPDGNLAPYALQGSALAGKEVYRELGCVYCHSQQVRHLTFLVEPAQRDASGKETSPEVRTNPDIDRGWGARPSYARDYVRERRIFLGTMRTGPDLRNVGPRYTASWQHLHLYNPQITSPGSVMPPYPFLYETRRIQGQPSPDALRLPDELAPPAGYEVVPTQRARNLVSYLLSLHDVVEYPEVTAPGSVTR